jgi:hypothetical protein
VEIIVNEFIETAGAMPFPNEQTRMQADQIRQLKIKL